MISGDPGVLDPNTEVGKRMVEYREAFGELDILLAYGNAFRFMGAFFSGLKMLLQKKLDIITAQDTEHFFLAWLFSKLFRIPWQMQIHTDILSPYFKEQSLKNKIRVMLAKFLLPRAGCIRVVSERIKKSVINYNKSLSSCVTTLPIFVDVEKFKNTLIKTDLHKKYPGLFIILMASRITQEKNIGLALEALSLIRANKQIILLVVGDGPEKDSLRLKAYSIELGDNVVFEINTADIISYYKTCDLFLLTSNYEGYGRTLIEAASAGAKIISSDVGIAPEVLDQSCIFKVGDKDDLAEKINAAFASRLKPPKPLIPQTKEEYLKLYKRSFEVCINKK
ncbi:MAG: glycosyltransferase family 4 protein [bacterium]|nr:glycosyltransferase family 4 protein [bacterium]